MATKWWKINIFTKMFFICFVYIKFCQLAKQYVFIPEIVAFEHLWPFFRKRPRKTSKIKFCPKSDYFLFSLGDFQHTCWMLCFYARNCNFWPNMNHELLLFLTFPYTRNANQRHFIIYWSIFLSNTWKYDFQK